MIEGRGYSHLLSSDAERSNITDCMTSFIWASPILQRPYLFSRYHTPDLKSVIK